MPWQITAVAYIVLSSFRAIVNRKIGSSKQDLTMYALAASFVAVLSVGLIVSLTQFSQVDHSQAWELKHHFLIGGLLFAVANIMQIKLFRFLPASVAIFLTLLVAVSVVLFSGIFGQDSLRSNQVIGGLFIAVSVLTVAILSEGNKKRNRKDHHLLYGVLVAFLAALAIGPALTNEAYLISEVGLQTYVLYGWGLQALSSFAMAAYFWNGLSLKNVPAKMHRTVWLYSSLLGLAGLTFVMSVDSSESIISVALSGAARVAFTLLFAYVLLKEREDIVIKLIGLLLSAVGLFFLFS